MKNLFYRLSTTRSFAKLFSLLAIAAFSFSFTDKAAGFPGTWNGGGGFFGSELHVAIIFGDTLNNKVPRNGGFFDVTIDPFTLGNTVSCEYAQTAEPTKFTPAACVIDVTCFGFQESTSCQGNNPPTITSLMTCQENAGAAAPGCVGTITVNPTSESESSILPNTVTINVGGTGNIANCNTAFPKVTGANSLPAGVIGSFTQEFAKNSKCTGPATKVTANIRTMSSEVNPVSVPTSNGGLLVQQNEAITGSCDSHIFNTTCGGNQGTTWFEVPASALTALGLNVNNIVNNLQTLQCGTDDAPTDFRFNGGNPVFKCPSCTNVQSGQPGEPLNNDTAYVLTQTAGAPKWSAVCPLILTP